MRGNPFSSILRAPASARIRLANLIHTGQNPENCNCAGGRLKTPPAGTPEKSLWNAGAVYALPRGSP